MCEASTINEWEISKNRLDAVFTQYSPYHNMNGGTWSRSIYSSYCAEWQTTIARKRGKCRLVLPLTFVLRFFGRRLCVTQRKYYYGWSLGSLSIFLLRIYFFLVRFDACYQCLMSTHKWNSIYERCFCYIACSVSLGIDFSAERKSNSNSNLFYRLLLIFQLNRWMSFTKLAASKQKQKQNDYFASYLKRTKFQSIPTRFAD